MKEWARQALVKIDRICQESLSAEEGLKPISLAARNAAGLFCRFVVTDADRWYAADSSKGGVDLDVYIQDKKYAIEFDPYGGYSWMCFIDDSEIVGSSEKEVTADGVDLLFQEPPESFSE